MIRPATYLVTFAAVAAIAAAATLLLTFSWGVANCNTIDAAPDAFLAECNAIGNLEHGAFYYGLEQEAIDHLRQADVWFLGNSRAQYAFSTSATDAFFEATGMRYFLLGFGYYEESVFIQRLVDRLKAHPRALVINADPFFSGARGFPAQRILGLRAPLTRLEYMLKAEAIEITPWLCEQLHLPCHGTEPAIYRSRLTGQWRVRGYHPNGELPLQYGVGPVPEDLLVKATRRAQTFFRDLEVDPACVVLTGLPGARDRFDTSAFAAALADRLGTKAVTVKIPMVSVDGTHMTPETAERWSAAFFAELAPLLESCPALRARGVPGAAEPRNPLDPPAGGP